MVALVMAVLISGMGLAIDGAMGYYYSSAAERAASAAALSGVIFMPNQVTSAQAIPSGSRNDATDRAYDEAQRNGFPNSDVTVTPLPPNQLKVTVSHTVPTFFMRTVVPSYTVSRYSVASYDPPAQLGQPGSQMGSSLGQLGTAGNYYFMHIEGYSSDRELGDAYTPNPAVEYSSTLSPASTDIHQLSGSFDNADPSLPSGGGYNYTITLPSGGGIIQVYNAVDAPDGYGFFGPINYCDNNRLGNPTAAVGPCSPGGSYHYWEAVSGTGSLVNYSDKTQFGAMEYTLFQVNNSYIHSTDTKKAQFKVLPIDATNWSAASNQYTNVNTGGAISQTYNPNGSPSNMSIYHNWVDVVNYAGASDGGLVQRTGGLYSGLLPQGTYRLRVDSLNYNGSNTQGNSMAFKGYGVRALAPGGGACATCTVSGLGEMQIFTPISTSGGGTFTMPLFGLSQEYAGHTVNVDIYDPGDIAGGGNVTMQVLDPSGAVFTPASPATVAISDLGTSRVGGTPSLICNCSSASFLATSGGTTTYNGHWVDLQLPIPSNYNPGANPYWSVKYITSSGVSANDVLTFVVGRGSNPPHLLP
jgi:hypothetical protein